MADKKINDSNPADETIGSKSSTIENVWQNYDAVFKDAVSMFKDKTLDFFGLSKDITITEPLKTEIKEIVVKSEFADLTFKLSDGKGLHFESEVALSKEDLFRFYHYHIDLIHAYGFDFTTVILVKDAHKQESLDYEMLKFNPIIVNCADYDADEILAKLQEEAAKGEPFNELELIYLPLFKSAKFWLSVLNSLKNRGVRDILTICADGLSGISEAIQVAFPQTEYQRCIVHMVRNTLKHTSHKHKKSFANDLKLVYHAPDEEAGHQTMLEIKEKWDKIYPNAKIPSALMPSSIIGSILLPKTCFSLLSIFFNNAVVHSHKNTAYG